MAAPPLSSLTVYPVTNYTFGSKPPKYEKDTNVQQRMERLKEKYAQEGARRSVDAIILVHDHGHPHVLLIQLGTAFFKLPGGRLRPGEDEIEGLLRKLDGLLAPAAESLRPAWRVAELLGTYFRPNFESIMYPYCPPHIQRPKELKHLYLLALPERCYFAVPKNMKLLAVPLFEIYDHVQRYGPVISAVPSLVSRFQLTLAGRPAGAAPAAGAAAVAQVAAQQTQAQHTAAAAAQQQQLQLAGGSAGPPLQQQQSAQQAAVQQHQQQPQGQSQQPQAGGGKLTISLGGQAAQQPQAAPGGQYTQQSGQQGGEDDFTVDFDD